LAKPLIIVESPAKARTIEKFLGRKYKVKASLGHLIDLPKSQLGVDVEQGFAPKYITIRGKTKVLRELQDAAKDAGQVLLATDPDREGEAIAWHLSRALDLDGQACRVTFQEITGDAVRQAVANPRTIDIDRVNAQQARRILDRLVGYELSPLLWRKVQRGLSAGRVQSVAVRLIVDREREIEAFEREEFWSLTAELRQQGPDDGSRRGFPAKLITSGGERIQLVNEEQTQAAVSALDGLAYRVDKVDKRARRRQPPAPFTTSTLQQEASRRHGFGARRTMQAAQQLYEGLDLGQLGRTGLVTYIRTDSTRVAEEAVSQARDYISGTFGADHVGKGRPASTRQRAGAVQDAHEAIRPTSVELSPDKVQPHLTADQNRIYRLVWERFLASQMAAAVFDVVSADISAGKWGFRATGQTLRFAGFMAIYAETREDSEQRDGEDSSSILPPLLAGEALDLIKLEPKQHFTQPPPRYSEASLVKALEELGIGRPSTYAPIIETIQQRNYVREEDRRFEPTPLGTTVTDLLSKQFPDIVDVSFTASMENRLDQVEKGQQDWQELLAGFYGPFKSTLTDAEKNLERVQVPVEETDIPCDKCGKMMVIKHGRFGPFLACPGFPECRNTKPLAKKVATAQCPRCGGAILEKKSKRGRRFYGCERYPECDFVSWSKPQAQNCPRCGTFLIQKRSAKAGTYYACAGEGCDYQTKTLRGGAKPAAGTQASGAPGSDDDDSGEGEGTA